MTADADSARAEFLSEAEDIVDSLNGSLLQLDDAIESGRPSPDVVNEIFRGAHSLKGLASMFDFNRLSSMAHELEDILDQLRLGKIPFNNDLYAILYDSFESLQRAVYALGAGTEDGELDFTPFLARIKRFVEVQQGSEKDDPIGDINIDPATLNVLSEYEEHRLRENLRDQNYLFKLSVAFSMMEFGDGLAAVSDAIKECGEIISTLPNSDTDSLDTIHFDLLVGTKMDEEGLREAVKGDYELEVLHDPNAQDESPASTGGTSLLDAVSEAPESIRGASRSVRVDINRLDHIMNIIGELVLVRSTLEHISSQVKMQPGMSKYHLAIHKQSRILDRKVRELQYRMMDVRMVPLRQVFDKLKRTVRRISSDIGKEVEIEIKGADTELDKLLVDELADPLMHMIRNSMDHGIELPDLREEYGKPRAGKISLQAYQKGNHVVIELSDDGNGINLSKVLEKAIEKGLVQDGEDLREDEIVNLIFHPGFSTTEEVSSLSGRGVGMDVVKNNIGKMGGIIDVETKLGEGSTFYITLPITLAIIQALFVEVVDQKFAIPLNSIIESVAVDLNDIRSVEGRDVLQLRDLTIPVFDLSEFYFGQTTEGTETSDQHYVVVISLAERKVGLLVRSLLGQQDVVIKPFAGYQEMLNGFSGATETGDETPVLVFDVPSLIEQAFSSRGS
jgi:two-component system chemotaxis sensor kinase CheA